MEGWSGVEPVEGRSCRTFLFKHMPVPRRHSLPTSLPHLSSPCPSPFARQPSFCLHVCVDVCECRCACVWMQVCVCACVHVWMHMCVNVCIFVLYVHANVCIHASMHACVCVGACICVCARALSCLPSAPVCKMWITKHSDSDGLGITVTLHSEAWYSLSYFSYWKIQHTTEGIIKSLCRDYILLTETETQKGMT